jgi:preprotein translocase subunit Sss1
MTLTIEEKIKVIQEKILEAERVIRYTRNPSEEDIDAQVLTGIREQIIEQVARQTQSIELFNSIINDLKNGIDQIG